jgi:hypothetical protein
MRMRAQWVFGLREGEDEKNSKTIYLILIIDFSEQNIVKFSIALSFTTIRVLFKDYIETYYDLEI